MKIPVSVDQTHINMGVREEPTKCPIAFAIQEAQPHWEHIYVDGAVVFCTREDVIYEYLLPQEASDFVQDFDTLVKVFPFKFEFDDGR